MTLTEDPGPGSNQEDSMRVFTLVLNEDREPHFRAVDSLDATNLLDIASTRAPGMRDLGEEKANGSVPFFAQQLVSAVNGGEHRDVKEAITNMTMCCWLVDSIYGGMKPETLHHIDVEFVVRNDGAIARTYVPHGRPEPGVEDMLARATWPDRA
ncbi:MAG: hypothetical protein VB138_11000 [Burkholderia sp.]